ncbi:MAG: carbamoyl-phosphate synthase domain-containing protein, partial [Gammaproteobacteria bacterium]
MRHSALLALEDGTVFRGEAIGASGQTIGEVVFNTALSGYQEILTDPSYCRQLVTLTYPHIGNVGTNSEDEEAARVFASGLVVRDVPVVDSNWRSRESLGDYLRRNQVVAIAGIDTRKLTRILREKGAQNGCIVAGDDLDEQAALAAAREFPGLKGMDLAQVVSVEERYEWQQGSWTLNGGLPESPRPVEEYLFHHIVAYDFGVKRNILRML